MSRNSNKIILLVEDEAVLSKGLSSVLRDSFEVIVAATGQEALDQLKKIKPDLILLDVLLPDKSGIEILQEIKANDDTSLIPVVVLTNLSDQQTVSKILEAGGKDYLVKSDWSLDEINQKIGNYLK